jgi:hypothetical protein
MRTRTVAKGLHLLSAAVLLVTLSAFYHGGVAQLLALSPAGETQFVMLGLFWGGILGGAGILVAVVGFLRRPAGERRVSLFPSLLLLMGAMGLFFLLLVGSFGQESAPRLRPGETIVI